ncbi:Manganese resistance protein MNR2 [Spathaspora sp. JA1]|nr:Manganese resistance protein MNR2 [Spathaspora sp. JA1]
MGKSKKYSRGDFTNSQDDRSVPSPSDLNYSVIPPQTDSTQEQQYSHPPPPQKHTSPTAYKSAPVQSNNKSSRSRYDSIVAGAHQARAKLESGDDYTESSRTTSPSGINPGAYIDHRTHNDLPNIHSSPARYRRRASQKYTPLNNQDQLNEVNNNNNSANVYRRFTENPNSSLPLTNRNLQHLLKHSTTSHHPINTATTGTTGTSPISPSAIAIDMDQYAHEQRQLARARSWNIPFRSSNIDEEFEGDGEHEGASFHSDQQDDRYSVDSHEFGESNPSSEHSSDSTSLDDVCFPDYYHDGANTDTVKTSQWPDLRVLEEFIEEELEEAQLTTQRSMTPKNDIFQSVNFQGNNIIHSDRPSPPPQQHDTSSTSPKYTESTPLMANYQVNEAESFGLKGDTVRVRPTSIHPWEMTKEKIPTILNKSSSRSFKYNQKTGKINGEVCRFTYFREDLNKTIHSPSISGLVLSSTLEENERSKSPQDEEADEGDSQSVHEKTIYEKLQDLFQPTHYTERDLTRSSSINGSNPSANQISTMLSPSGVSSTNLVMQAKSIKVSVNEGTETPRPGTAYGSMNDIPSSALETETRPEPFWLDVFDPTEEEMKVLSKTFGIHPLTTEDIFLGEAREKVELFKSYYFICFTSFDVVYERRKQRAKENEKKMNKLQEMLDNSSCIDDDGISVSDRKWKTWKYITSMFRGNNVKDRRRTQSFVEKPPSTSVKSKGKKIREGELSPLNMYMIVFKDAVITFHFSATPHPINVRRRARMLKEYLTVSSDWICYALIDDITDSFAPMIDTIESEVNSIEDAILKMHSGDTDSDDDTDSDSDDDESVHHSLRHHHPKLQRIPTEFKKPTEDNVFVMRKRSKSTVDHRHLTGSRFKAGSASSSSTKSSSSKSTESKILGWKRKGDMLRRIGECRKRVMSVLRLLGTKADVIKGFSKRFNEVELNSNSSKQEIGMYLGDIQDHIVTMVQALNHYEKLLARFHSNYLAQINIDMTKVNNDTNDVLGKITILGTIVLPINVVTGLWGMNCIVPGQDYDGLGWFFGIVCCMILFSICAYNYAKRVFGL